MDGAHGLVGAVLPRVSLNEGVEHFLLLGGGHGLGQPKMASMRLSFKRPDSWNSTDTVDVGAAVVEGRERKPSLAVLQ